MENELDYMLTTIDNPYNPFDEFDSWLMFDKENDYNTCEYLARIAKLAQDFSTKEEETEIERAMDEIVIMNPLGIYKKVTRKDYN